MFGRRKEYSLSTMTFDELGKMISGMLESQEVKSPFYMCAMRYLW